MIQAAQLQGRDESFAGGKSRLPWPLAGRRCHVCTVHGGNCRELNRTAGVGRHCCRPDPESAGRAADPGIMRARPAA